MRAVESLVERIARTIEERGLWGGCRRVGVAVSGGADSVCLLHVLLDLAPRWDLEFTVLHLDHGLRGEESRGDAEFVQSLADGRDWHSCCGRSMSAWTATTSSRRHARPGLRSSPISSAAVRSMSWRPVIPGRIRRRRSFSVFCGAPGRPGWRGSGRASSQASSGRCWTWIEPKWSPFCGSGGSNGATTRRMTSPRFARNRLRHGLLPQIAREWNPSIASTLANTAKWAADEEAWWEGEIGRLSAGTLEDRDGAAMVRADFLTRLPVAVARRFVRHAMARVRGDLRGIDFDHVETVLRLARKPAGSGGCRLPGLEICRSFDWVRFVSPESAAGEAALNRDAGRRYQGYPRSGRGDPYFPGTD